MVKGRETNTFFRMDKKVCIVLGFGMGVILTIFIQFTLQAVGVFTMEFTPRGSKQTAENSNVQFRYDKYLDTTFCKGDGIPSRERNRIYGGQPVDIEEVPWAVAIMKSRDGDWSLTCAGTVIGSSTILSAAHCFPSSTNASIIKVAAGFTFLPRPEELLGVKKIHNHEDYDRSDQYRNDLSIFGARKAVEIFRKNSTSMSADRRPATPSFGLLRRQWMGAN